MPFAAPGGVATVFDRPSSDARQLGVEDRSTIQIIEVRDGWLRFQPQPDDSSQCWVRESASDGDWKVSASQSEP